MILVPRFLLSYPRDPMSEKIQRGLEIRDCALAWLARRGSFESLPLGCCTIRVLGGAIGAFRLFYKTPFSPISTESSLTYGEALVAQQTRNLCYGLDVWHKGREMFAVAWSADGGVNIVHFRRGAWENQLLRICGSAIDGELSYTLPVKR